MVLAVGARKETVTLTAVGWRGCGVGAAEAACEDDDECVIIMMAC
jgi:hypothetical protein